MSNVDLVLCLDASGSMSPCIDGVREHVGQFLSGLKWDNRQQEIDLRVGFIAHSAGGAFRYHTSSSGTEGDPYGSHSQDLFLRDSRELARQLSAVETQGNECPLVGLDFALDFPWRPKANCHRVVIMMTDEPAETGGGGPVSMQAQLDMIQELQQKIVDLGVILFLVAPTSPAFQELTAVPRSTYKVINSDNDGLANVDFSEVLGAFGKTVSMSRLNGGEERDVKKALFGQDKWVNAAFEDSGRG